MPIHDWTRVDPGLFHAFHQGWTVAISAWLNCGGLPPQYSALVERHDAPLGNEIGGAAVKLPQPHPARPLSIIKGYAVRANRIAIHQPLGRVVAVIAVVSPGHKSSKDNLAEFVKRTAGFIKTGVHTLLIDLFTPQSESRGIHEHIWNEFGFNAANPHVDKPLTLVSYYAGTNKTAYLEQTAIGDQLLDMPLWFGDQCVAQIPLESTYTDTWNQYPKLFQQAVLGVLNDPP